MRYRETIKKVNGKKITIEVRQVNKPNIDLVTKGIMEATKNKK